MIRPAKETKIKKLIVFSTEDSSKISSWSNVPYLFCETLKANNIQLVQVTLSDHRALRLLALFYKKSIEWLWGKETSWEYSRSTLRYYLAQYQMNKACRQYSHDAILVMSCSYAPTRRNKKPLIMFCDWPYEYHIRKFLGRVPDGLEYDALKREHQAMATADFIFILFPLAREYVVNYFDVTNSYYLGNVINAIEKPSPDDLAMKAQSQALLFIGKPHYKQGADQVIAAYLKLKNRHPDLTLDIVGMDASFFKELPAGITCHGYLDKGDSAQSQTYYQLLRNARIFVNTNPKWASFSATLEAMYFQTPVIVSRYPEMEQTFGSEIDFGAYYPSTDEDRLEIFIENLMCDKNYQKIAIKAYDKAKKFTWDAYVKQFLKIVSGGVASI